MSVDDFEDCAGSKRKALRTLLKYLCSHDEVEPPFVNPLHNDTMKFLDLPAVPEGEKLPQRSKTLVSFNFVAITTTLASVRLNFHTKRMLISYDDTYRHSTWTALSMKCSVVQCHQRCMTRRGLISAPPIPVGFRSFLWIPVEFRRNLPAKISLLPRNCGIPVFTPEWSPESGHRNGTGIQWPELR